MTQQKFSTRAIHAGQSPDPTTGAINVPIYASSTYAQEEIGKHRGYEYSRVSNPTRTALEENLASLEGGTSAHVFSSGMAAIAAMVAMLKTGDHVICGSNVYGGTPRLFDRIIANYGIRFTYVDTTNPDQVREAIEPNTKLVHIETPTNPLMQITDIRAIADICHEKPAQHIDLAVDNTFMSPYFQRPLEFGADLVMHSTTKFLNGHSDGLGGVLVGTTPEHKETFAFVQKCTGGILSPFECFLVLRGVKTLAVRMKQHEVNGHAVANYLAGHPKIPLVMYPGLPHHPQHDLARRQMSGFGALITFEAGSFDKVNAILRRLRVCTVGESLGGVETLVSHPASMTHAALGEEGRAKIGLTDGMMRISVGIEDAEDLLEDLDQALSVL
jgi:cystathionine beta-lyase/cystathionine gamma-synthase